MQFFRCKMIGELVDYGRVGCSYFKRLCHGPRHETRFLKERGEALPTMHRRKCID